MKKMYQTGIAALIACSFLGFLTSCLDDDSIDHGSNFPRMPYTMLRRTRRTSIFLWMTKR